MPKVPVPEIVEEWTISFECPPEVTAAMAEAVARLGATMPQNRIDEALETLQKIAPVVRQSAQIQPRIREV